jgi:hypothetical protein
MTWLYFVFVQSVFVFVGRPSPWVGAMRTLEVQAWMVGAYHSLTIAPSFHKSSTQLFYHLLPLKRPR